MNTASLFPDARSISWKAIIAGAIVALSIHLLLVMLGTGISALIARGVEDDGSAVKTLAIGSTISWTLSALISLWVGGGVAGRVGAPGNADSGRVHGFVMWSTATVCAFLLMLLGLGGAVAGAAGIAKGTLSAAGGVAAAAAPAFAPEAKQMIEGYSNEITAGGKALTPRARRELATGLKNLLTGDASSRPAARDAVVNALVNSGAMAAPEAGATVDEWIQSYDNAKAEFDNTVAAAAAKARKAADAAAASAGTASIWMFIAFWVGALASVCGGHLGATGWPRKNITTVEVRSRPVPAA